MIDRITASFYAGSAGIGLNFGTRVSVFEHPEVLLPAAASWLAWLCLCDRVARMGRKGVSL